MPSSSLTRPALGTPNSSVEDAGAETSVLLSTYRPGGGYDEMRDPDGSVRAHYRPLVDALSPLAHEDRETRFRAAEQYLREAGVFYRAGGESSERLWPLAFPPLLVEAGEWRQLEADLRQRATYLERLLADLYGERRLVRDGTLPGRLLGHNPEFLRPLATQGLSGRPLLRFIAVDLGRGPDGAWRVLADRTEAPSGAGFALENRVASSRAFPDLVRSLHIRRLAGFFSRFRETLDALDGMEGTRVGLLTPGPLNETYFEHSYLSRYLGFHLLEGGDLVVHGDEAKIRTVDGLRPVRVLWRRLDADFTDPLELFSSSRIGTPGLVRAVRAGTLDLVNALGSGILETPALAAFEDAMAEALIGEPLRLRSIETFWCGDAGSRAQALADNSWHLANAFTDRSGDPAAGEQERASRLAEYGASLIARRPLALSTVPIFAEHGVESRPVTLRVFLARSNEGWDVMPGGFARAGNVGGGDTAAIAAGGRSIDVWVASEAAQEPVTLLGARSGGFQRRLPGSLPSRAADNLYWLGRSVERTEAACRLWRAAIERAETQDRPAPVDLARLELLARSGVGKDGADPATGLRALARTAFDIASRIRDRFSPDGWRVLAEILEMLDEASAARERRGDAVFAGRILTRLAGFAGLVQENMYQFSGWRFLECGRRVERGLITANVGAAVLAQSGEGVYEALLDFTDSRMTYRRRFSVELTPDTVLDLCVLDPLNPRSLAYQVAALRETLASLPGNLAGESLDMASRRAARLLVRVQTAEPEEVDAAFLARIAADLGDVSNLLTERYFTVGPQGSIERFGTE